MAKIGRNELCLCGSGKKYKRCCMDKPNEENLRFGISSNVPWGIDTVEQLSTQSIFEELRYFGIEVTKEKFLEDVRHCYSAMELAERWMDIYPLQAGIDEDFIWMAATVLWRRLSPEQISSEQLDGMMQKGYNLENAVEICKIWLQVWEHLKQRFRSNMRSIDEAEEVFEGNELLSNWCQDLEMELGNAGLKDRCYYEKRIKYCQEFCSLFPNSDSLIMLNMKRAEAESYFALGRIEKGEQAFADLVEEFPNAAWGYIGWGDMYYIFRMSNAILPNYERAKQIYELALSKEIDDRQDVIDRLKDLEDLFQKNKGIVSEDSL